MKTEKIRCLHIITGLDVGGAERYLLNLIKNTENHVEHTVLSIRAGGRLRKDYLKHSNLLSFKCFKWQMIIQIPLVLYRIALFRPRYVVGWMHYGNFIALIIFLSLKLFNWKLRLVWNIRQSLDNLVAEKLSAKLFIFLCAKLSSLANVVIFNSFHSKKMHEKIGMFGKKNSVVPNGVQFRGDITPCEEGNHRPRGFQISDSDFVFALIARWDHYKDHPTFFEASRIVLEHVKHGVKFILAGKGLDKSNQKIPKDLIESDNFQFLGEINNIEEVLCCADFSVLSSRSESFPNVLIESMAHGTPCISTDVGDAALIIDDTGFIVPKEDPSELAKAMIKAISLPENKKQELKLASRERVKKFYSIESSSGQYFEILKDL